MTSDPRILPGGEGSSLPRCSLKPSMLCSDEITPLAQFDRVAPVTKKSGKAASGTKLRSGTKQACHDRLANAMYHWARVAVSQTPEAARNMPPSEAEVKHASLRSIADAFSMSLAMLKTGTLQPSSRRKKPLINGGEPSRSRFESLKCTRHE